MIHPYDEIQVWYAAEVLLLLSLIFAYASITLFRINSICLSLLLPLLTLSLWPVGMELFVLLLLELPLSVWPFILAPPPPPTLPLPLLLLFLLPGIGRFQWLRSAAEESSKPSSPNKSSRSISFTFFPFRFFLSFFSSSSSSWRWYNEIILVQMIVKLKMTWLILLTTASSLFSTASGSSLFCASDYIIFSYMCTTDSPKCIYAYIRLEIQYNRFEHPTMTTTCYLQ